VKIARPTSDAANDRKPFLWHMQAAAPEDQCLRDDLELDIAHHV
jgi:hypothetical protein